VDCQEVHADKETWWNEEIAEAVREKKISMEIGRDKTRYWCGRSTRRVDKMQRGLFPPQKLGPQRLFISRAKITSATTFCHITISSECTT